MRIRTGHAGQLVLELDAQEASILSNLVSQLLALLQSHSSVALDPDPLFASLEVGGSEHLPDDPALARLLPDAYEDAAHASDFRRVTEQGLINRKIEDALVISTSLSAGSPESASLDAAHGTEVVINQETLPPWIRSLTALRLSIAARLGIDSDADHEAREAAEEHANTMLIYDWLAAILDLLLRFAPVLEESIE